MLDDSQKLDDSQDHEGHWVAVSDLMAGLMMVFMLVSVVFMINVETERDKIRDVAILYDQLRTQLYKDLQTEFAEDMPRWGAELDEDLAFRFNNTDVLFDKGEAELKPEFQAILDDFFPRYVRIITQEQYRDDILEVRIEGHTSSGWFGARSEDEAYILNMNLSQERTRSTLAYVLGLKPVADDKNWLKAHLTANGLSSAKVVRDDAGSELGSASRRVEFRVRTDAEGAYRYDTRPGSAMKLYNFLEESEFNALKHRMGADGFGHFVEFDPEHQLTFGERDQLARGVLIALPGQLRILPDRTLALKNSRVWIEGEGKIHLAACAELHRLRDADSINASTRDPEKTLSICPDCLAELKYLGLDGRKSRRLSEQLDELFSMERFRQDYPFYPV